jgi:hypothetical protein
MSTAPLQLARTADAVPACRRRCASPWCWIRSDGRACPRRTALRSDSERWRRKGLSHRETGRHRPRAALAPISDGPDPARELERHRSQGRPGRSQLSKSVRAWRKRLRRQLPLSAPRGPVRRRRLLADHLSRASGGGSQVPDQLYAAASQARRAAGGRIPPGQHSDVLGLPRSSSRAATTVC